MYTCLRSSGLEASIFIDKTGVTVTSDRENIAVHYTTDGSDPVAASQLYTGPFEIDKTTTVAVRSFRGEKPVSPVARLTITRVSPLPSLTLEKVKGGLHYRYFEGNWDSLPDFTLLTPVSAGIINNVSLSCKRQADYYAIEYKGFIAIPSDGVYTFYIASDDGSRLYISEDQLINNDGQHGILEKSGSIALGAGLHPIRIIFFEKSGGDHISLSISGPGIKKQPVTDSMLFVTEE